MVEGPTPRHFPGPPQGSRGRQDTPQMPLLSGSGPSARLCSQHAPRDTRARFLYT